LITAEQRMREIAHRQEVDAMAAKLEGDKKSAVASNLAVRDRLMRRLNQVRIATPFHDDLGDFNIETRLMTSSERERFMRLNQMLAEAKGSPEKYGDAMKGLKSLVGNLCLTEGLGKRYWESGEPSDDVVLTVMLNTFNAAGQVVLEGLESFRKK